MASCANLDQSIEHLATLQTTSVWVSLHIILQLHCYSYASTFTLVKIIWTVSKMYYNRAILLANLPTFSFKPLPGSSHPFAPLVTQTPNLSIEGGRYLSSEQSPIVKLPTLSYSITIRNKNEMFQLNNN